MQKIIKWKNLVKVHLKKKKKRNQNDNAEPFL